MKAPRLPIRIALLALVALTLAVAGCGDEESDDGSDTAPAIEISIPTDGVTAETTTSAATETDTTTGTVSGEVEEELEKAEKTKGKSEKAPGVGEIPKPSASQTQRIAECIERAQGDPQKLAKCGRIAVN